MANIHADKIQKLLSDLVEVQDEMPFLAITCYDLGLLQDPAATAHSRIGPERGCNGLSSCRIHKYRYLSIVPCLSRCAREVHRRASSRGG